MRLFDANMAIGSPNLRVPQSAATGEDILKCMDSFGVERALVWHTSQLDGGPATGNPVLTEAIQNSERLLGAWAILPPQTDEFVTPDLFDRMKTNRIAALRSFPTEHKYLLRRAVFGSFLDELCERRIPLLYSVNDLRDRWNELYDLMEEYPRLTCIVCDVGVWGVDRFTWPLLEAFSKLYLETSYVSLEAGGLDAAVKKFGSLRFVYGSGFPYRYPEASVMDLIHSCITDDSRERIAWRNMNDILAGVQI